MIAGENKVSPHGQATNGCPYEVAVLYGAKVSHAPYQKATPLGVILSGENIPGGDAFAVEPDPREGNATGVGIL